VCGVLPDLDTTDVDVFAASAAAAVPPPTAAGDQDAAGAPSSPGVVVTVSRRRDSASSADDEPPGAGEDGGGGGGGGGTESDAWSMRSLPEDPAAAATAGAGGEARLSVDRRPVSASVPNFQVD